MSEYKKYVSIEGTNFCYPQEENSKTQDSLNDVYWKSKMAALGVYDAKLEFIKAHSASEEEYILAKSIVGIREEKAESKTDFETESSSSVNIRKNYLRKNI